MQFERTGQECDYSGSILVNGRYQASVSSDRFMCSEMASVFVSALPWAASDKICYVRCVLLVKLNVHLQYVTLRHMPFCAMVSLFQWLFVVVLFN